MCRVYLWFHIIMRGCVVHVHVLRKQCCLFFASATANMSEQPPTVDQLREELLRNYQLADVVSVLDEQGREVVINRGGYGRILKVLVNGALCAAKEIHHIIVGGPDSRNVRQFIRECELMSQMRHPNVVQFLGVHQPETPPNFIYHQESLPWLIMEYIPYELHSLLEKPIEIPMCVRVSILLDITRGLSYLHNRTSMEIIHRDLSARNVLLTSSLIAKLADFGVSKRPVHDLTMTRDTGNVLYMPPENKYGSTARYNSKMDIFSFGVVMLFAVVKEFPSAILDERYTDEVGIHARSEIARRQGYFDRVEGSPNPTTSTLVTICKSCLEYNPQQRPTAAVLSQQLSELPLASEMDKLQVMVRLRVLEGRRNEDHQTGEGEAVEEQETLRQSVESAERVAALEAQVEELREQLGRHSREVTTHQCEASQLREQQAALESNLQHSHQQIEEANRHLGALQGELSQTQRELAHTRDDVSRQQRELDHKEWQLSDRQRALDREKEITDHYKTIINMGQSDEITGRQELQRVQIALRETERERDDAERQRAYLSEQIQEKDSELTRVKELLQKTSDDYQLAKKRAMHFRELLDKAESRPVSNEASFPLLPPSGLKATLSLSCSKQDPTPFGLHSAQCVRYQNKLFYGGATQAAESNQKKHILSYDLDLSKWSELNHPAWLMHFAMVVVNGKFLLVGGYNEARNQYSDQVLVYNDSGGWKEFCKLPNRRARAAAFSYRSWLVVAGGCTDNAISLNQVVAYDCATNSGWKTLASLPEKAQDFQLASYTSLHHSDPTKDTAVVYLTSCRQSLKPTQPTMAASVPDLITKGAAAHWLRIPDPPIRSPGVATLRGHLLALGGHDPKRASSLSNKVYMYLHGTREWLVVAEISSPRAMCVCIALSDTKFMVLGGKSRRSDYSTVVEVFNLPTSR